MSMNEKKELKFNNGKFTILQISDAQDLHIVRKTMLKMLNTACKKLKPDLVIFTGDNILGNHLRDARFGTKHDIHTEQEERERLKTAIDHIAAVPQKYGIPFTALFGNHDDMNSFSKSVQADMYKSYDCFVGLDGDIVGTFNLPVMSSDGTKIVYNIWCMDSCHYDKTNKKTTTGVLTDDLVWYINKSNSLRAKNGGKTVDSLMFQHIPMPENKELMQLFRTKQKGCAEFYAPGREERYARLDKTMAQGYIGEPVFGCEQNCSQLEIIKQQGDVKAVVSGHEHKNCYEGEVQGIKVIQTAGASFRCYGNRLRGVRLFTVDENNTSEVNSKHYTYFDLCGKGPVSRIKYVWSADGEGAKKAVLITAAAMAAAVAEVIIF